MYMHHFLPPFLSDIELKFVSRNAHLARKVPGKQKQSTDHYLIGVLHVRNGFNMLFRSKKHMYTGLGVNIIEHDVVLVLVYGSHGNIASDNRAENTHRNSMKR